MKEKKLTGYPSIDKPWQKYYTKDAITALPPQKSMFGYLYENNNRYPDQIAIKYYGAEISFKNLFYNIDVAAAAYHSLGLTKNESVCFLTLSMPEVVFSFYGLNKLGVSCNFINVLSSVEEIQKYIIESNCKIIVCMDLLAQKVQNALLETGVEHVICLSLRDSMSLVKRTAFNLKMQQIRRIPDDKRFVAWCKFIKNRGRENNIHDIGSSDDIAIIGHTGGTTGFPKNVLLTNQALNSIALQYKKAYIHERQQVALDIIAPQSVYGISVNMHMPLCLGMSLAIIPKFDGNDWPQYIKWYKPNHIAATPPYVLSLMNHKTLNLSSLITVAFGGDGMAKGMEETLNAFLKDHGSTAAVTKGYGLSETGAVAFMTYNECNKLESVGIPLPLNKVMIWNEDTQSESEYGTIGEICIQGPSLMKGYASDSETTSDTIRHHNDGGIWLHSGDLGYVDVDGFLFINGRIKRIILSYKDGIGGKIYPVRIEKLLSSNVAIEHICVIGVPDIDRGAVPHAYCVLKKGFNQEQIESELIELCKTELPEYARPTAYHFCSELPITSAGKVDYRVLESKVQKVTEG